MFRIQLQILTLLSFFFLNYSILTFAGNLPSPNSRVDNIANPEFVPSITKKSKSGFTFGRRNAIATGLIIVITLLDIAAYKLRQIQEANIGEILNIPPSLLSSEKLCRRFSLADILSATHNFDDELVVGRGGFGKVYKGVIDNGSISVAVKRLNRMSKQGAPQFWTEIELLSKFRHSNLVSLIGYCIDCNEMILVYEYMVHGALSDHLYKIGRNDVSNSTLCWVQRLKICIGAARGLEYLHTGTGLKHRVIHRDIKSSNILLDENWAPKISDFGLSRIGPANQSRTHVSTKIKGTFGYLDPEYLLTHKLTKKSDVYAFGIVLFEVLCGRLVVDLRLREDQWGLAGWAQHYIEKGTLDQIVDPNFRWQILPNSLTEFFEIADQCLHYRSKKRPTMTEVVASLELALALQERKDSSMIEEECFNLGIVGADDIQENAGYSIEQQKVINVDNIVQLGDANSRQSRVKPGRMMAFTRMVRSFLVGKVQVTSEIGYFTLRQIKAATSNFDSANKIGEGGYGPLYKGVLSDGSVIAVKKLSSKSKQGNREFVNEIGMISGLQHPNLVNLYGSCIEGSQLLLVYEYMENNSLAAALFAPNFTILGRKKQRLNLDWPTRKKIFLGIARGLSYLHEESSYKIVHRNITATSVLLDKDLKAKISNFGLTKLDEEENSHISTRVAGTLGYMAPEYAMRGYLTDKADVYSFGIVALEIVSGKSNRYGPKEDFVYLLDWAYVLEEQGNLLELVDPILGSNYNKEEAMRMLNLALLCTNISPTLRPSMSSVVSMLEGKIPIQVSLIKSRFKAFETLSQDSQTKVLDVSHNSQEPRSLSMDGPWIDSSFSVQSNEIIRQLEQG